MVTLKVRENFEFVCWWPVFEFSLERALQRLVTSSLGAVVSGGAAGAEAQAYSASALLAASEKGVLAHHLGEVLVDQGADDEVCTLE
jgi:hypothetical protein